MVQRRFGPTLGAGVAVVEEEGDKAIQPAQLGVTAWAGILEKGPVGRAFLASKKKDFQTRAGTYIPSSLVPDAAFDFYNHSDGRGELWLKRVVDGTQTVAEVTLYSRHQPVRRPILKVLAGYQGDDNPGRWAGKRKFVIGTYVSVLNNTLTTGKTFLKNEWKGGKLIFSAVAGKSYDILANTTGGVVTVPSDIDLAVELGTPSNQRYILELVNDGAAVSVEVSDGTDNPTTEFNLTVYLNGDVVASYENLSMDPLHARYVENVVNQDTGNFWVKVDDLNTGAVTAATRPANHYGKIKTVTPLVLTADVFEVTTNVATAGPVAALATVTYGGSIKRDTLTLTCTTAAPGAAVFGVVSANQGALANLTQGTAYATNEFLAGFTLNNSGTGDFEVGDIVTIDFFPFAVNAFAGGTLIPDVVNNRRDKFVIASNTVNTITVVSGSDLSVPGAVGDQFLVIAPTELAGGYDGTEDVLDATYLAALEPSTTQFRTLLTQNKGLVKLATPGVNTTAVQKAGLALAAAFNWQYRVEVPSNIVTEEAADQFVNETIGKSDYGKVHFPSYAYVTNPLGAGLKLVSLVGAFQGREAKVAGDYDGFHKVAGGIEITLPGVIKLPTGLVDKVLDEEFLNPRGINVVKFLKGNCIMWGGRSMALDPTWKFAQQREQMSHYENVLRENFDWIVFAINNVRSPARSQALTALRILFEAEYAKDALDGKKFEDACTIKLDDEINTPATRAAGDLNAKIGLNLANAVERFVITIGKKGIFDSAA